MDWVNYVFVGVWAVASVVFLVLGAYNLRVWKQTKLVRFSPEIGPGGQIVLNERLDIGKAICDMAETHNGNVRALEDSIRQAALLSATLNLISLLGAVLGLVAQWQLLWR